MADTAGRLGGLSALLLAVLGVTGTAGAITGPIAVTTPTPVAVVVGSPTLIPGGSVAGFTPDPVRVVISVGSGTLSVPASVANLTVPFGYPAFGADAAEVAMEGAEIDVNSALSELRWTPSTQGPADVTIEAGPAGAAYERTGGHYYQVVTSTSSITWDQARAAAAATSIDGYMGYLATITNAEEQALLSQTTPGTAWLGASDFLSPGTWRWATGPEAGTTLAFSKWGVGEPTGTSGRHVAALTGAAGGGLWTSKTAGDPAINDYLVEYGGSSDATPIPQGHASSTLTAITPPDAPIGFSAAPGTESATVAWQPPASDGGSAVMAYVVTGSPSGWCSVMATARSCTVTGLTGGTPYTFRVAAINEAALGAWSGPSVTVTPQYSTSVALVVSPIGVASAGQTVAMTATVAPQGSPRGQVVFMDGSTVVGTTELTGSVGLVVSDLAVGTHELSVRYSGDGRFGSSDSATSIFNVVSTPLTASEPAARTTPSTTEAAPTTTEAPPTTEAPSPTEAPSITATPTTQAPASSPPSSDSTSVVAPVATVATVATTAGAGPSGSASVHVVFAVGVGVDVTAARFTVRGQDLRPGSVVIITAHSDPVLLAAVDVDPSGAVKWDGVLPAGLTDGDHTIVAQAMAADGSTVERVTSFGVAAGRLVRIGESALTTTATTVTTPSTTADTVADSATGVEAAGGSSGLPKILILLLLLPAIGFLAIRWRRSRAVRQSGQVPAPDDPATRSYRAAGDESVADGQRRTATPRARRQTRRPFARR